MTTVDKLLFFLLGALMWSIPTLVPAFFPPGKFDGLNTSALWLELMGSVNGLIGAICLMQMQLVSFLDWQQAWSVRWDEEAVALGFLRPTLCLETLVQL